MARLPLTFSSPRLSSCSGRLAGVQMVGQCLGIPALPQQLLSSFQPLLPCSSVTKLVPWARKHFFSCSSLLHHPRNFLLISPKCQSAPHVSFSLVGSVFPYTMIQQRFRAVGSSVPMLEIRGTKQCFSSYYY